jgi:hypothetical protein
MNNRPDGDGSLETYSHPNDMIISSSIKGQDKHPRTDFEKL